MQQSAFGEGARIPRERLLAAKSDVADATRVALLAEKLISRLAGRQRKLGGET
jgi:hypothetical protein